MLSKISEFDLPQHNTHVTAPASRPCMGIPVITANESRQTNCRAIIVSSITHMRKTEPNAVDKTLFFCCSKFMDFWHNNCTLLMTFSGEPYSGWIILIRWRKSDIWIPFLNSSGIQANSKLKSFVPSSNSPAHEAGGCFSYLNHGLASQADALGAQLPQSLRLLGVPCLY